MKKTYFSLFRQLGTTKNLDIIHKTNIRLWKVEEGKKVRDLGNQEIIQWVTSYLGFLFALCIWELEVKRLAIQKQLRVQTRKTPIKACSLYWAKGPGMGQLSKTEIFQTLTTVLQPNTPQKTVAQQHPDSKGRVGKQPLPLSGGAPTSPPGGSQKDKKGNQDSPASRPVKLGNRVSLKTLRSLDFQRIISI